MTWLRKNRTCRSKSQNESQQEELIANQESLGKKFQAAKESNKQVLDLLEENHFHIKLYIAAGGTPRLNGGKR